MLSRDSAKEQVAGVQALCQVLHTTKNAGVFSSRVLQVGGLGNFDIGIADVVKVDDGFVNQ